MLRGEGWLSMRRSWLLHHRWSTALMGIVAILVVGLLSTSLGFSHGMVATTSLTMATPTLLGATPTPPPQLGFTYYTEDVSNFQVQYPDGWATVPQNPGVEIDDNTLNPTFIMQVLLPTENLDPQTDWVQYEFDNLRQTSGISNFQPTVGTTQFVIGGEQWTSRTAMLQQGTNIIAVRVLATVHHDRPYIINMLAANVDIAAAQNRYFTNILSTFAFLT